MDARMATEGLTTALSAQAMAMARLDKEAIIEALVIKGVSREEATLAAETALATAATNSQAASVSKLKLVFEGLKSAIVAHPYLAAAAAITAVAVAIARVKKAADEAAQARRDKAVETGKAAQEEQQQIAELYEKYQEANKAYQDGTGKKEDLEIATRNLIDVLGDESGTIRNLKGDYEALNEEIEKAVNAKRLENLSKMIAAVDAKRESVGVKYGTKSEYTTGLGGINYDPNNYVNQKIVDIISNSVKDVVIRMGTDATTMSGISGNKNLIIGNMASPEERYKALIDAKNAVIKQLAETPDSLISGRELAENSIYKWILDQIEELEPEIKELNNLIDDSNKAALDYHFDEFAEAYFGDKNATPKDAEDYYRFRDYIAQCIEDNDDFVDSLEDTKTVVDRLMAGRPFSKEFASEINEFKHALNDSDLDKTWADFFNKIAANNELNIGDLVKSALTVDSGLQEWADKYGYTVDDIISHVQKLREEISKPAEDAGKAAAKTNKEYEKFKKNVKSLRIDIVKALGQGVELSEEQNEVFLKWKDSLGYTKDQLEEIYKLFQMMYKETPASEITAKTVGDRVRDAREAFEQEQLWFAEAEKEFGDIDLNQTQFGNINMDNRQFLEWTEENLEKYKDIIESYGQTVDDYAGTISTVLGGWDEFSDGSGTIPIAFSPMLQTESGEPELLTDEVIHKYINTLIKKADEEAQKAGKAGWTNEMLFDLDAEGVEVDGKKIKGIIAAVGDEAERVSEIMHFVGSGGSIQLALKELGDAYNEANAFAHYYILDDVGDLLTLQDEIKKAGVEWERYQKILEQGDPEDLAGNISDAIEKATKDIELGRIDAPSVWGAAKLLFSDDKLANELGYDLNKIAAELNSGFIKALFGKPENEEEVADYAARISNYLIENADKMKSVELIQDPDRGTFQFWYTSLEELADDMGLSEAATTSLLKALDAYGVEMMMSGKEMQQYINDYRSLISMTHNAKNALNQLVTEMAQQGVWEPHALQALQQLRDAGVISGDDSEFIETIKRVYKTVEETNNLEMHPEVYLDRDQEVRDQAAALWEYLESTLSKEVHTTVVIDEVAGEKVVHEFASGTQNAPGGVTLVNEKGPELISDNGVAYIANGGKPGFTVLSRGAIVFNAEETKDIFRRGYPNKPVNAYANGTGNTINKASLRERLISGRRVKGLAYGTKPCPECGYTLREDATRCPNCGWGYQQQAQYKPCPECGYTLAASANKCPNCGWGYPKPQQQSQSQSQPSYNPQPTYDNNTKPCPECGYTLHIDAERCPNCGWGYKEYKYYNDLAPGAPNRQNNNGNSGNTSGGSSGYTGGGGGGSVGHADYESEKDPEKVDWIAVLLNRIQRGVAALEKIASSGFKQLTTRLKAATEEVKGLNKEIAAQQDAYGRYLAEAESVGLSSDLAALVQSGQIDISEYDDETRELIDKYTEWYNTCHFMRQRILTIVFNCWNTLRAFQLQHTDETGRSANA